MVKTSLTLFVSYKVETPDNADHVCHWLRDSREYHSVFFPKNTTIYFNFFKNKFLFYKIIIKKSILKNV